MLDHFTITSRHNKQIVEVRKLHQRKHRRRQGRFLVEGLQLLNLALDAGIKPVEVFYCRNQSKEASIQAVLNRFREAHANLIAVSPSVMETISDHGNSQSIIATFTIFEANLQSLNPGRCKLIVVVDRPQSPANLGMIFRTADAVGVAAIILTQPCVDPLHPKAVRISLGTVFNVPFSQTQDIAGLFSWIHQIGFRPVGTDPHIGTWDQDIWRGKVALILGSDVQGMSSDMRHWVKDWIRLPMTGEVDSLSSAVAGSVLMYDWFRVNHNYKNSLHDPTFRSHPFGM